MLDIYFLGLRVDQNVIEVSDRGTIQIGSNNIIN